MNGHALLRLNYIRPSLRLLLLCVYYKQLRNCTYFLPSLLIGGFRINSIILLCYFANMFSQ